MIECVFGVHVMAVFIREGNLILKMERAANSSALAFISVEQGQLKESVYFLASIIELHMIGQRLVERKRSSWTHRYPGIGEKKLSIIPTEPTGVTIQVSSPDRGLVYDFPLADAEAVSYGEMFKAYACDMFREAVERTRGQKEGWKESERYQVEDKEDKESRFFLTKRSFFCSIGPLRA